MSGQTIQPGTEPLTAVDRCDRCGAQAFVRATMLGGGDLLFCAHHFHKHEGALRSQAVLIHDESHRLEGSRPSVSANAD